MTGLDRKLAFALCLAALALAALGAGSAGATVLCQESPTLGKCPKGKTYGVGQKLKFAAGHNVFTEEEFFCEGTETEVELTAAGSAVATVKGKVLAWTFSKCGLRNEVKCTVEAENLPYLAEVHWTAGGDGTMTVEGEGEAEPYAFITCIGGVIECGYGGDLDLDLTGGNPAILRAEESPFELKAELGAVECPEEVGWDATMLAKGPTAIWVAKE